MPKNVDYVAPVKEAVLDYIHNEIDYKDFDTADSLRNYLGVVMWDNEDVNKLVSQIERESYPGDPADMKGELSRDEFMDLRNRWDLLNLAAEDTNPLVNIPLPKVNFTEIDAEIKKYLIFNSRRWACVEISDELFAAHDGETLGEADANATVTEKRMYKTLKRFAGEFETAQYNLPQQERIENLAWLVNMRRIQNSGLTDDVVYKEFLRYAQNYGIALTPKEAVSEADDEAEL